MMLQNVCLRKTGKKRDGTSEEAHVESDSLQQYFFLFLFSTGDLSEIMEYRCVCGGTSLRLDGIYGRVGDAIKIGGLFVAPSQLNRVKERFGELKFQLIISSTSHEDILPVRLEPKKPSAEATSVAYKFTEYFRSECSLTINRAEFLNPGTIREAINWPLTSVGGNRQI